MSMHSATKTTNNLIGCKWAFIGFLLFVGSLLWFLGVFFTDAFQALWAGIPIPSDPLDFVMIFSALFMGGFCMAWGGAMLRQREWGALAGGLVRLVLIIYLLMGAAIFYRDHDRWLPDGALSFYNRYAWLVWFIFGVFMLWLTATTGFLLWGKSRRDYYASAYQDYPAPTSLTCNRCGLSLQDGRCPEHDMRQKHAYLKIGERRELLPYTEDKKVFIIGRQKDHSEAFITLSQEDTAHPGRISGRHVWIEYRFDHQRFRIQDLASLNKTYLNDDPEPLQPNVPYLLSDGDKIDLAHVVDMIFECDD